MTAPSTSDTASNNLTEADRHIITMARELAGAHGDAAVREVTGAPSYDISAMVYAEALGRAQYLLAELVAIAERLGGGNG